MNQPLFYQCVVLDNQDPLMLGRVRARLLTDNYYDMVKSFDNPPWNEEKDKWSNRDPFIFNPLLPFFIYQVPKVDEMVNVLYYNSDFKYRNQFYIQALFSTPTNSPFEYYVGAQKFTGIGVQYTNPLPIKNQDGTYQNNAPKGVFPEPGDNALLGRGNADVVVKENGVLIRTNKIKGNLKPNVLPIANDKGAFLQLEKFDINKVKDKTKKVSELVEDVMVTKYLIEYQIINPENSQNSYSGFVYLYSLKSNNRVNSKEIKIDSQIDDLKSLIITKQFQALSFNDTVNFINRFISEMNKNNKYEGRVIFNPISKFPIYYRPSIQTYNRMFEKNVPVVYNEEYVSKGGKYCFGKTCSVNITVIFRSTGLIVSSKGCEGPEDDIKFLYNCALDKTILELKEKKISNVLLPNINQLDGELVIPTPIPKQDNNAYVFLNKLFGKIKLNSSAKDDGYGLIYAEDKVGTPYKIKKSKINSYKYTSVPVTYAALGADKVFFLSQTSEIPGKGVINFDGTLYGISNEKYVQEIIPKTSSAVRGEELMELINLIVRFLITHTHAYPGMAPVPVSYDGVRVEQILSEIQNASNKILNANIRLN